jgi:tRNA-specific 2-thiouridylase
MSKSRVVVAMSGGVDSSVAALLLKEEGYDVIGITMRLYSQEDGASTFGRKGCCTPQDVEDARRVCQILEVPHYVQNFEREFRAHVIDYFVAEYQRGRTPHPCIACNDRLKFDFLLGRALALGCDYVATGHYARLDQDETSTRRRLLKGLDHSKDQSYVLFTLRQNDLPYVLLPVGWYGKDEIRRIAAVGGLPVADKPDSQDICFIPNGDYRQFIREYVEPRTGEVVDMEGNVLGSHDGIENFTIGQRRGIGVATATGQKTFVIRLDPTNNRVMVGGVEDLFQSQTWISRVNYLMDIPPERPIPVSVKIRYKSLEAPAILEPHGKDALIRFEQPQAAVTPGQAAVFYRGDEVIGGGFIEVSTGIDKYDPTTKANTPVL